MASRRGFNIGIRYALGVLREFRWTLLGLTVTLLVGATLYALAPAQRLRHGRRPTCPAGRCWWPG